MQVWELAKGSEWESGVSSVEQELAGAAVQWGFLAEKRSGQGQGQGPGPQSPSPGLPVSCPLGCTEGPQTGGVCHSEEADYKRYLPC